MPPVVVVPFFHSGSQSVAGNQLSFLPGSGRQHCTEENIMAIKAEDLNSGNLYVLVQLCLLLSKQPAFKI